MTASSNFALARRHFHFDDDPEPPLDTIGSLVQTPALIVEETAHIEELRRLLVDHRIPAIIVADRTGSVSGLVTRTDVLRSNSPAARAADVMSRFVFALPAAAAITKAAALIGYEGIGQVIVTGRGGALVGIVSAVEITRYFAVNAGALRRD